MMPDIVVDVHDECQNLSGKHMPQEQVLMILQELIDLNCTSRVYISVSQAVLKWILKSPWTPGVFGG